MPLTSNPLGLYQAMIEQTGQAFFAYEIGSGQFVYLSPEFKSSFALQEGSCKPDYLLDIVHEEERVYVMECLEETLREKVGTTVEFRVQFPKEDIRWICLNAGLIEEATGEKLVIGRVEDITAQRAYNNHLKKFSNKKNSILNILSHDLAGPLSMIQNLTGLLTDELKENGSEEVLHIISLIEKTSKHGSNLLHEFMNQEFLESSQTDLVTRRVNLVEKMKEALEEYEGSKGELIGKQIEFKSAVEEIYAEVDDLKFLQVITNLISNSLKFTPDGGHILIELEVEADGSILVTVADDGVGIPEKYHATLFDKFTNSRRPGLKGEPSIGLGMSIVKTIVEWHKGQIWFESEENKGTTFYIRLPKP